MVKTYRRKHEVVEAFKLERNEDSFTEAGKFSGASFKDTFGPVLIMKTDHQYVKAIDGDYLVKDCKGILSVYPEEQFKQNFVPIEEE